MRPLKDHPDHVDYQTAYSYVADLVKESNYGFNLDSSKFFYAWYKSKLAADIMTYRDQSYTSKFTGTKSPVHHTPFMKAFDDSMQTYLKACE